MKGTAGPGWRELCTFNCAIADVKGVEEFRKVRDVRTCEVSGLLRKTTRKEAEIKIIQSSIEEESGPRK
jgi:hypothetical protein